MTHWSRWKEKVVTKKRYPQLVHKLSTGYPQLHDPPNEPAARDLRKIYAELSTIFDHTYYY